MRKIVGYVGVLLLLTNLVLAFMAYFMFSFDPQTKNWSDGLGRKLVEAPWIVQFVWQHEQWAGLFWFAVDMVLFWTTIFISFSLISIGFRSDTTNRTK